jgi:vancomycin resistance protein VanJ
MTVPREGSYTTPPNGGGRRSGPWRRGVILAVIAGIAAFLLAFHDWVPNSVGNLGSLLETVLPWVGLAVPLVLIGAAVRRSCTAVLAAMLPTAIWIAMFGNLFVGDAPGGTPNLRVVTHNVNAGNLDPAATARDLLAADPGVIALEEVTAEAFPVYEKELSKTLKHSVHRGTVALWSKYPITGSEPVNIKMGWTRAFRAEVRTPQGPMAVYVAHLASVRVNPSGFTADQRDQTIDALADEIAGEDLGKVLLLGDLNGTANDRSLAPITSQLRSAQGAAGAGFGFSWPTEFPLARIDHILTRGVVPTSAWTLPETGSDHLPIAADLKL